MSLNPSEDQTVFVVTLKKLILTIYHQVHKDSSKILLESDNQNSSFIWQPSKILQIKKNFQGIMSLSILYRLLYTLISDNSEYWVQDFEAQDLFEKIMNLFQDQSCILLTYLMRTFHDLPELWEIKAEMLKTNLAFIQFGYNYGLKSLYSVMHENYETVKSIIDLMKKTGLLTIKSYHKTYEMLQEIICQDTYKIFEHSNQTPVWWKKIKYKINAFLTFSGRSNPGQVWLKSFCDVDIKILWILFSSQQEKMFLWTLPTSSETCDKIFYDFLMISEILTILFCIDGKNTHTKSLLKSCLLFLIKNPFLLNYIESRIWDALLNKELLKIFLALMGKYKLFIILLFKIDESHAFLSSNIDDFNIIFQKFFYIHDLCVQKWLEQNHDRELNRRHLSCVLSLSSYLVISIKELMLHCMNIKIFNMQSSLTNLNILLLKLQTHLKKTIFNIYREERYLVDVLIHQMNLLDP
jgi:hypothetical protein